MMKRFCGGTRQHFRSRQFKDVYWRRLGSHELQQVFSFSFWRHGSIFLSLSLSLVSTFLLPHPSLFRLKHKNREVRGETWLQKRVIQVTNYAYKCNTKKPNPGLCCRLMRLTWESMWGKTLAVTGQWKVREVFSWSFKIWDLLGSGTSFCIILGGAVEAAGSRGPTVSRKMRLSCRPQ